MVGGWWVNGLGHGCGEGWSNRLEVDVEVAVEEERLVEGGGMGFHAR